MKPICQICCFLHFWFKWTLKYMRRLKIVINFHFDSKLYAYEIGFSKSFYNNLNYCKILSNRLNVNFVTKSFWNISLYRLNTLTRNLKWIIKINNYKNNLNHSKLRELHIKVIKLIYFESNRTKSKPYFNEKGSINITIIIKISVNVRIWRYVCFNEISN